MTEQATRDPPLPPGFSYWAFLSYSHADNCETEQQWADWLHEKLETYKLPEGLVGMEGRGGMRVPDRLFPIFQDEKELSTSSSLSKMIETALTESLCLIVICSPRSANSLWVNQEIIHFKKLGRSADILPIIISGEPNATQLGIGYLELECFPEALRFEVSGEGLVDYSRRVEPFAADMRREDGSEGRLTDLELFPILDREILRLVAGITGVRFDELVQRDKQREILRAMREAQNRTDQAEQLVLESLRDVERVKAEGPKHAPDFVFSTFGKVELQLEKALGLDASREDAVDTLRAVRYALVETGITSGDLNLASLYLDRLRTLGNEDDLRWRTLQGSLAAAWEVSDPGRNRGLRDGQGLSLIGVLLSSLWALALWGMYEPDSVLVAAALISSFPFLMISWDLTHARIGHERSLQRAIVVNYFATVLTLVTLNLVGTLLGLCIAASIAQKDSFALVWRYAAHKP